MSGRKEKQARAAQTHREQVDERRRIAGSRMEALLGRALVEDLCNHGLEKPTPTVTGPRDDALACRWCIAVEETLRYIQEGARANGQ